MTATLSLRTSTILSVIIPIYNRAKYLHRCIGSVLSQTFTNLEVILVDDGSTDESGKICDDYASRHTNVVCIHKKNSGVSDSRFEGLRVSKGKYISFVDSDDWLDDDYFSSYVKIMEESFDIDVCVSGMVREYPDGSQEKIGRHAAPRIMDSNQATLEMCSHDIFRWELCGKVYRKILFNGISYNPAAHSYEDLEWNWQIFRKINKLYHDDDKFYHYRFNNNSTTTGTNNIENNSDLALEYVYNNMWTENKSVKKIIHKEYARSITAKIREMFFYGQGNYKDKICELQEKLRCLKSDTNLDFPMYDTIKLYLSEYDSCKKHIDLFWVSIRNTLEVAKQHRNIYVYGAGLVAKYVSEIARKTNIQIKAFVISNDQHSRVKYLGLEVIKVNNIAVNNADNAFVLAVNDTYREEIKQSLILLGHKNIFEFETKCIL